MEHKTDNNATVRAWLLELLTKLELAKIEDASKTELNSYHFILDIKFKV